MTVPAGLKLFCRSLCFFFLGQSWKVRARQIHTDTTRTRTIRICCFQWRPTAFSTSIVYLNLILTHPQRHRQQPVRIKISKHGAVLGYAKLLLLSPWRAVAAAAAAQTIQRTTTQKEGRQQEKTNSKKRKRARFPKRTFKFSLPLPG